MCSKRSQEGYREPRFPISFSALLYNIWILIDGIISKSLLGRTITKHLVTGKMFATILYNILDNGVK